MQMALSYDPLCWETYGGICSLVYVFWLLQLCMRNLSVTGVSSHLITTSISFRYHAPSEAGADILLDSLRMGTLTAAQNILLDGDLLSIHENNASRATIETFSSTSPFASSSMMDL
ncbi:LOW QUALITY PROTEIN: hypothetical protein HID58_010684 [Brassica napus]|uniref:Uncharacterized protein n=1 Tax=Brassica napus TaxID=3708 RepID=A0ABQ8DVZ5_BRANA|nr:LOW QUALITY PROTEIN: hypothetical protein HID58_010684 [Brassica napus]